MSAPLAVAPTIELVPIDQLHADPANPRRISEEELDALERSLREFGFVQPVLARREDGIVIGGHQRLVAARRLPPARLPPSRASKGSGADPLCPKLNDPRPKPKPIDGPQRC